MNMTKDEIVDEIAKLSEKLGGVMRTSNSLDHTGRQSKKITIEYDIREKQ